MSQTIRAIAHPNIALAKYWGKTPGTDNAPAVPSLSVTLAGLTTRTSLRLDPDLAGDTVSLNGHPADPATLRRVTALIDRARARSGVTARAEVISTNDFPTAAGLASSASGFAALAVAARAACGLPFDPTEASDWARRASASSARSLLGGYVELPAGVEGRDEPLSAFQVAPPAALDLRVIVAVTTEQAKSTLSTDGMNHTARTSPYYPSWVSLSPRLLARVRSAVLAADLEALGVVAEESALAMHASALAAAPGVLYWIGATIDAMHRVRALRASGVGAWFTIDAGPHVKVLCAPGDAARVSEALLGVPGVLRVIEARPGEGARLAPEPGA
jgi:diphosphomevalonate decarboxylase